MMVVGAVQNWMRLTSWTGESSVATLADQTLGYSCGRSPCGVEVGLAGGSHIGHRPNAWLAVLTRRVRWCRRILSKRMRCLMMVMRMTLQVMLLLL